MPEGAPTAWRPSASRATLVARAALVERTRAFFAARGVLEVDVPLLQGGANLDHGVIPFRVDVGDGARFLPTSPEHPLKRLVAAGHGAVWCLAPAFRRGEQGRRHAPEFRMLEWYRPDWDDRRLALETIALLALLTGRDEAHEVVTFAEAFRRHAGCDPDTADQAELIARLGADAGAAHLPDGSFDRAAALDLLLTAHVEPHLGRGRWTVFTDYPAHACAQARLRPGADGRPVAARFELYRDGVELANGYWELRDAGELAGRQMAELATRRHGECPDRRFASAMAAGLPDCAGVAVGFDRVVMLALGLGDIAEVQAFAWPIA